MVVTSEALGQVYTTKTKKHALHTYKHLFTKRQKSQNEFEALVQGD